MKDSGNSKGSVISGSSYNRTITKMLDKPLYSKLRNLIFDVARNRDISLRTMIAVTRETKISC